jgi:hypothetical protein
MSVRVARAPAGTCACMAPAACVCVPDVFTCVRKCVQVCLQERSVCKCLCVQPCLTVSVHGFFVCLDSPKGEDVGKKKAISLCIPKFTKYHILPNIPIFYSVPAGAACPNGQTAMKVVE